MAAKSKNLIADIIKNDASRVDFDLDNWITDFEQGFPRFEKINPAFRNQYWGQGYENRPRIKELNEEGDAQQIEGYRLIEFFPDRENKDESYILFGTPVELMTQMSMFMNMHLMFQSRDIGTFMGYPVDEYLRRKPRVEITIQLLLATKKEPPYYKANNRAKVHQVTIPQADRSKINFKTIRAICGGSQGQTWGEWNARAYLSPADGMPGIHQMVASGSTEKQATKNLEQFLQLTTCKVLGISQTKIDYTKGERAKDPNRKELTRYTVYPGWMTILNSRLVALDDERQDGKKTLSGTMLSKKNKLWLYMEREPIGWAKIIGDILKRV